MQQSPILDANSTTPEDLDFYEGTWDVAGVLTCRLDEELELSSAYGAGEEENRLPMVFHCIEDLQGVARILP